MHRRRSLLPFCWLAALGACTPIGLWLWDDPAFEVARVRILQEPAGDSAVTVALQVRNPNDYELSTTRFELTLLLDGHLVGRYERDSIIPLSRAGADTLSLPFHPSAGATPRRLAAFRGGTHRFAVEGRAMLKTPFGDRPVRVDHAGDIAFGGAVESASGGGRSRIPPGLSTSPWPAVWGGADPSPRQ